MPYTVSVVGAPTAWGQPIGGVDTAPAALRVAGLRAAVTDQGWRLVDRGDAVIPRPSPSDPPGAGRNSFAVGRACHNVAKLAQAAGAFADSANTRGVDASVCSRLFTSPSLRLFAAAEGDFVLCLGGDHSVAAGSISGVLAARPDTAVLWIDAHADVNTPGASPSGNLHGTPVSLLLRLHEQQQAQALPGWEWMRAMPALAPSRLAYIGLRDLDPGEKAAVRALGLCAYTMADVDRHGIGRVVEMALGHLLGGGGGDEQRRRPLHLSFDIDAVDPSLAPATGTAVPGGLTLREAHFIAEAAAATGCLGSMDLVEVNPALAGPGGGSEATVRLGLALIASALGRSILPHQHMQRQEPPAHRPLQ